MSSEWSIALVSGLAMLVGIIITAWLHSQNKLEILVLPTRQLPDHQAFISVIMPARNEARNIRRSVKALLSQDYPAYEVIVVDDRSTDETPHLLREIISSEASQRLRIVQGEELPLDWAGKPHALVQGVQAARGEWLCFIDADTFAGPRLLSSAYQAACQHQADLFTILTNQELGSFWESTILPLVFTALSFGFPARSVNDPAKPDAIANGQFILIRKEIYLKVGGHSAIRQRIDEDKALAEMVKRSGYRLIVADGRHVASTRMYTSLPEIWEGWTKNIYLGLRDRLWLLLFGALAGAAAALLLPIWLIGGVAWMAAGGGLAALAVTGAALVLWAYLLAMRVQASLAFGISPLYALTLPLGALLFTAMMFASAYKVLSRKGVTWKGRRYTG